jgi:hypothetical protein
MLECADQINMKTRRRRTETIIIEFILTIRLAHDSVRWQDIVNRIMHVEVT